MTVWSHVIQNVDDDRVFKALADPTRRHLPDRLVERDGRTLTDLESELEMSRFGVMKHLRVLAPEMAEEEPSRVTWEIEPQANRTTLLTVVHDQLEGAPNTAESVSGIGWMYVLSGLKTLLETGKPLAG